MEKTELHRKTEKLAKTIEGRNCIAWIGSGLSMNSKYPNWLSVVDELCKRTGIDPLKKEERGDFRKVIKKADECKTINKDLYCKILSEEFWQTPVDIRVAHNLLLGLPFKGYVTTNFDPILCQSFRFSPDLKLFCYPDLPLHRLNRAEEKPLFHVHGLARIDHKPNGENLVFSESEFETAYQGIVGSFLNQLFTYHPILFIGCRLHETYIQNAIKNALCNLEKIREVDKDSKLSLLKGFTDKYMIVNRTKINEEKSGKTMTRFQNDREINNETANLTSMGVEVLDYIPENTDHRELDEILKGICNILNLDTELKPSSGIYEEDYPT